MPTIEGKRVTFWDSIIIFLRKFIIPSVLVLLVMFAITFIIQTFLFNSHVNSNVVAEVGATKITRNDLNKRLWSANPMNGTPENPGKVSPAIEKQLLDSLIEKEILKQNADRLRITVSDKELAERIAKDGYTEKDLVGQRKTDIEEATRTNIIREKTQEKVLNWLSGDYIKVRFDRHFSDVSNGTDAQRTQDRQYAESLANGVYQDLSTGKITFEQAEKKVQDDKTIDINGYPGNYGNQYGAFGKDNWNYIFIKEPERKILKAGKEGQVLKPFVGKLEMDNAAQTVVDGFFYLVKIKEVYVGEADNYQDWLNAQKEKLLNNKLSFGGVAFAAPYKIYDPDLKYYDYNNNLTTINGIWFKLESDYSDAPCTGTPSLGSHYGTYYAEWKEDANGNVTRRRKITDGSTTGYTCTARDYNPFVPTNDTSSLAAGCEHNNFYWTWGYSGALSEVSNGTVESLSLANSSNDNTRSLTDSSLASGTWKQVLNDWHGTLSMRVRAKYPTTISYLNTVVSPADAATAAGTQSITTTTAGGSLTASFSNINTSKYNSTPTWTSGCPTVSFGRQQANTVTCTATFSLKTFTITPSAETGASINPSTTQTVTYGGNSTFSGAAADSNHDFGGFSVDGAAQSGTTYAFSNVTANHSIVAKATPKPACSINSFTATGNGSTSSTSLTISNGTSVSFALGGASNATGTPVFSNGDTTNSTEATHTYTLPAGTSSAIYAATYSCSGTGGPDSHTINITVSASCSINAATATDSDPNNYAPLTVTLGGTYSNNYASPIKFAWSLPGGVPSSVALNPSIAGSTIYNTGGATYTATLRGEIDDGFGTSCGNKTVSIPVVIRPYVNCNITPADGLAPLTVRITWDTDPGREAPTIDLKDGSTAKNTWPKTFYYTYPNPNTYRVTATNTAGTSICKTQDGGTSGVKVSVPNSGSGGEITPKN